MNIHRRESERFVRSNRIRPDFAPETPVPTPGIEFAAFPGMIGFKENRTRL
jgi:hypothetical protein